MAKINGIYIFVIDEQVNYGVQIPEHAVEEGLSLTDYIRPNSKELSINGEIVGKSAMEVRTKIRKMQNSGTLVKYVGRTSLSRAVINSFGIVYTNEISGGCTFTMTLKEIRIANSPYKAPKKTKATTKAGVQQVQTGEKKTRYHTVKKGESRYSISEKYKSHGCTIDYLTKNNNNTSCLNQVGNWTSLKVGAKMKVGVW